MRVNPITSGKIAKILVWLIAMTIIGLLIAIIVFILFRGLRVVNLSFLAEIPREMGQQGGILTPIIGTVAVTLLAVVIAMPFGIGTAYYLAEYTKGGIVTRIIRFCTESLAGIPSIVYGLFGLIFFVTTMGLGWSILSGGLTVAIMILPTIIRTSEEAIRSVPQTYREVSFTLGATKWQTIRRAVTPSAIRGIANGIILSIGRCVAETAAVMLTAGTVLSMPDSIFSSSRTMALHFYLLAMEGIAMENAFGTAAILIILILFINIAANVLINRMARGK
jgi:phosphate transport system permease protein